MRHTPLRHGFPAPALALALLATVFVPASARRVGAQESPTGTLQESEALRDARASLQTGAYDEAIRSYRNYLEGNPASVEARRGLVHALVSTGRYEDAVTLAERAPVPASLANARGEALRRLGRRSEAEQAFREAIVGSPDDRLTAEVNLADLDLERGREAEAMAAFDRLIDVYNQARGRMGPRDLVAVGRAVHRLARNDPRLFRDALRAFDEAVQMYPGWAEPTIRAGQLFLEKYQSPEAKAEFQRVLDVNPRDPRALLGMARALEFDGTSGAWERTEELLEINPRSVDARVLRAELLVSREDFTEGAAEAERALDIDASSLEALAALAAARFLSDDKAGFERARRRALELNPGYGGIDAKVAEASVRVRRYQDAVDRASLAVSLDPSDWSAWGVLGLNQLRTGDIEAGRTSLQRAFEGDPYNPWFKNTLDLLDTFERFEVHSTPHFELFLHGTEADLLEPYVAAVAEEGYDTLVSRYGIEPPLPIRVEVYPSHADFSVRTLGETGLGALGVTFGSLVVMDSPAARRQGEYNWASTLWHELSHVFHLAATDHRVPRWFSEGLAVHEQRKARPNWGHRATIPFLEALRDGRLKNVSDLNDGFMRPEYPEQVIFSYYEASLVFQFLEERHGFGVIRSMIDGYRAGRSTEELFDRVVGTSLADFDRTFAAYMKDRFAAPLRGLARVGETPPARAGIDALTTYVRAHPGDLLARIRLGALLVGEERYDEAREHLREALKMFPEYGGPDSPYLYLARIHRAQGDLERAAAALARLTALSESNYGALLEEAELMETVGRPDEAARALGRAMQVFPYDIETHERMAELAAREGDTATSVRERTAVVALDPADRAEAFYLLAKAQGEAGDTAGARRTVIRALDIAPTYDDALELLLQLRGGSDDPPREEAP